MTTAETIRSILIEQVNGYRTLLDILQRERACLLRLNALEVETLSKEKDTIVLKLRLLEEERIRLVSAFVAEQAIAEEAIFTRLDEVTGDDSFQRLRLQLISLLQGITELNGFNRILIERSASVVKNALNFLGSFGLAVPPSHKGALLSREA
jgi:flagellar biosynthesis/type III secretory pathway chaperone